MKTGVLSALLPLRAVLAIKADNIGPNTAKLKDLVAVGSEGG